MKLAVNYSTPLVQLITEQALKIDLIKCPDWEGMLFEARPYGPITLHFDMDAGLGNTFKVDFTRIEQLIEATSTPHVNTHLVTPRHFDSTNPLELHKINALWREEIQLMIDQLGPDSIALEQFPYTHTTSNIRPATDSKIFSQVILDTGCMLLLDLAHAQITADTLGIDTRDYIRALPLDRLVELHITGIQRYNGVLTDHFGLTGRDWALLAWALQEIRAGHWRKPDIVAFEYGGVGSTFVWRTDINVIRDQVPKLYEMVHAQG